MNSYHRICPNKITGANSRLSSPVHVWRQFVSVSRSPASLSAAVAQFLDVRSPAHSMSKTLSPTKRTVVKKVERHVKRPLTVAEIAVVAAWDEAVAKIFSEDWTGRQLAEAIAERTRPDNPVAFLESLAGGKDTVAKDREKLAGLHKSPAKRVVRAFAFDAALGDFSRWLLELLKARRLPTSVHTLHFGLHECASGCLISVSGYGRYDRESNELPDQVTWFEEDPPTELSELSSLWADLKRTKAESWVTVQAMLMLLVRAFFEEHAKEFQRIARVRSMTVTTGFDEGDLYEVRSSISPKT